MSSRITGPSQASAGRRARARFLPVLTAHLLAGGLCLPALAAAEVTSGPEALLAKIKWQKEHLAHRHSAENAVQSEDAQNPESVDIQQEHTSESVYSESVYTESVPFLSEEEQSRLVRQFHQFSGEVHASVLGTLNQEADNTRDVLLQRARGSFGVAERTANASASTGDKAVWATVLGSHGALRGDRDTASLRGSSAGFMFGSDFSVSEDTRVGVAAGFSNANARLDDRYSKAKMDTYTLGAYGSTRLDQIRLGYGAAYSWHGIGTTRQTDDLDPAKANYRGRTAQLFGEAAYAVSLGTATVEPYLGLAYVNTRTRKASESGYAALNTAGASQGLTFSTLGTRASNEWELDKALSLTVQGGLGWRHAYGDVTPSTRVWFDQGDRFQVTGVPIARDALVAAAGITLRSAGNMSLGLGYSGQFARKTTDHSMTLNASWVF